MYGWMKSIVIYIILSGIVINMAPSGSYKKYIRFFTGLIMFFVIAKPVSFLFEMDTSDIDVALKKYKTYEMEESYLGDDISDYLDISIEKSIEKIFIDEGFKPYNVELITNNEYKILKCTINYIYSEGNNSSLDEVTRDKIKNKISDVYNVEKDNIYIVSR